MATILCPHCNNQLRVPSALSGKIFQCPICKKPFTVPQLPPEAVYDSCEAATGPSSKGLAVTGFIFSFCCSIIGLILCIVALVNMNKNNNPEGRAFAIAGIVISGISILTNALFGLLQQI